MADNEADLRAALHAAVEAGVIEGWQYAFPREHIDEWRISLTTEQARVLFCECPCPTLCYVSDVRGRTL